MWGRVRLSAAVMMILLLAGAGVTMADPAIGPENAGPPKAVFDFRIAKPKAAKMMLKLIHKTYANLSKEKRHPDFVIVLLGPAVKLISTDRSGFSGPERQTLQEIGDGVAAMEKDGIRFEGSELAAYFAGVDPATFLPGITRVDNGLVSIIDYQSASYSLVPVY